MNRLIVLCFCVILCLNKTEAHPGVGIVMDSMGNVFYTDLEQVWKISPDGNRSIAVENVHTHELYLDENDNLYGEHEWYNGEATDTWGNYVWCLSNTGMLEKIMEDVDGFIDNDTLIRDLEGNSYWAQKWGDFELLNRETLAGENSVFTDHQFRDIRWMYYSKSDQNLYVVDHLKIKKVTPAGSVHVIADDLKEARRPFNGVADRHYVFGLCTDTENNVYTAVYGAGKVKKIGPGGEVKTVFESQSGWSPCGGMITPDGSRWIMEFSKNNKTRVRKINPEGTHTLYDG